MLVYLGLMVSFWNDLQSMLFGFAVDKVYNEYRKSLWRMLIAVRMTRQIKS